MRATALALLVAFSGCEFAVKHPPATAAIVAGTIGFGTCEIATDEHGTCALISLGTAAALGLITWAAIAIGGPGDTVLQSADPAEAQRPVPQDPTLDQPSPAPAPTEPAPTEPAPVP
ncbi:MAG: hypothetical protein SFX73_24955 [Kofleriaceae bacterium]|nr:hypothetical protein [Kofleriaceae bacterium]